MKHKKMDKKAEILKMLKKGASYTEIMAELDCSPSTISVIKKKNKLPSGISPIKTPIDTTTPATTTTTTPATTPATISDTTPAIINDNITLEKLENQQKIIV
ncbi:unnamed protein product, partial [marine sediment metagenome]